MELADQHWLMEQLIPILYTTSLERNACIVSQTSMELMDTDRLVRRFSTYENALQKVIDTRHFLDPGQAWEWLC